MENMKDDYKGISWSTVQKGGRKLERRANRQAQSSWSDTYLNTWNSRSHNRVNEQLKISNK